MAIAEPYAAVGHYVNETHETGEQVTSSIYGAAKMDRLAPSSERGTQTTSSG